MTNAINTTATETRGRPSVFSDKFKVVAALQSIGTETEVSRFIKIQLAEQGYVAFEQVKSGGRGRPSHKAVLTGKGKTYLNFSKNWK